MAAALAMQRPPSPAARHRPARHRSIAATARLLELDSGAVAFAPNPRRSGRPRGTLHFLGGAFVSATPHLVYPLLLSRLADAGYTSICTPYDVTFNHIDCARRTAAAFDSALAELRGGGGAAWVVPQHAPVFGVGHSNGALLHMLIGAVCLPQAEGASGAPPNSSSGSSSSRAGNILMSFNNLQVAQAVPVPLGLLTPVVKQLRGDGRLQGLAQQGLEQAGAAARLLLALAGGSAEAVAAAAAGAPPPLQRQQQALLQSLQRWDPALLQLGSVFDEVGDGFNDFFPPPDETRRLIAAGYRIPATMLVQFKDDNTDETPEATALLRGIWAGSGGGSSTGEVDSIVLPGTHVTPCGVDAGWRLQPGARFGPGEALAAAAAAVLQADTRRLADQLVAWLDAHS